MNNYNKRVFETTKWLYVHNIPDDVVLLVFDFVGDFNENNVDLLNKNICETCNHNCYVVFCHSCVSFFWKDNSTKHKTCKRHLKKLNSFCETTPKTKEELYSIFMKWVSKLAYYDMTAVIELNGRLELSGEFV